ncbi:molybdenum cofactor guanylyltransferase [Paenibacillus sp. HJGM_3]|uniref:molybdenum cofactor guanylyltransferase n=1 Tax=Paenibacillus sp. HJGM_3 TaxID=3379816 RepID=UPI003858C4F8
MTAGVILAGGRNRRMGGQPKGLLELQGEAIIARQIRLMRTLCAEMIVVTNEPELYRSEVPQNVNLVPDRNPGLGPLAGMEAAFACTSSDTIWIVGCDMPFVSPEAARLMRSKLEEREELDAVIPCLQGKRHPLHGLYRKRVEKAVSPLLETQQLRLMGLFERIRWVELTDEVFVETGIGTRFATNVNTPEEWVELRKNVEK